MEGAVKLHLDDCQVNQESIDIWTRKPIGHVNDVDSADMCRASCERFPGCAVWTWGSRRGVFGLTDVCFLKAFAEGVRPVWKQKPGVVSGFSCRRGREDARSRPLPMMDPGSTTPGPVVEEDAPESFAWEDALGSVSEAELNPALAAERDGASFYVPSDGSLASQVSSLSSATREPFFSVYTTQVPEVPARPTTARPAEFDCADGYAETGWSAVKKNWCCQLTGRGCTTVSTSRSVPFDCSIKSSWRRTWSEEKRKWCCRHHGWGCTTAVHGLLGGPFDCMAGYERWKVGWSRFKKQWCCEHQGRGCTTPSPGSNPFNCDTGSGSLDARWPPAKREWCCAQQAKGCPTTTLRAAPLFDCRMGFSSCTSGWSVAKSAWCCRRGRCCAPAPVPAPAPAASSSSISSSTSSSRSTSAEPASTKAPRATAPPSTAPPPTTAPPTTATPRPPPTTEPPTPPPTPPPPTTTTTTGPTTTTLRMHYPPGSLFCFALMQPIGYELLLMQMAWKLKVGIFACDEPSLLSSRVFEVSPGLQTGVVASNLKCEYGGEFYTAMNTDIFLAVWQKVIEDGRFALHSWTIKVDPDCVFFPSRLKAHLGAHAERPASGVYLNNCKYGLHGPIEIFSRNAVRTWASGRQRCIDHFNRQCNGPCAWGEDLFIDQCLWKVLKVKRDNDSSILSEDHCDPLPGWNDCKNRSYAAFHPFKTVDGWKQCLDNYESNHPKG